MLCRRCGMESSTTDTCEWCKMPMLPTGTAVTARQASAPEPQPAPIAEATAEAQAAVAAEPPAPVASPASQGLGELNNGGADETAASPPPLPGGGVLVPLGGGAASKAASSAGGGPSHGISAEATRTSVDVANYLGPDKSLFRPMTRSEHTATSGSMDPLARRRTSSRDQKPVSDIPDNVRLMRSLMTGLAISFPLALIEFLITKKVPEKLFVLPLVRGGDSIVAAIAWGVASGVFLGFGMGALLVQFKKGAAVGLVLGLFLGWFGMGTDPAYWGALAAGLTGIMVGRIATVGYRRVIQV